MEFTPFLTLLAEIEDPRRAEGKLYRLPHVVLFAILAMVAGANSYRAIHRFIDVHLPCLLSPRCTNAPNRCAKPQPLLTKTPPGTPSIDRVTKPVWSRCSTRTRPWPIPNGLITWAPSSVSPARPTTASPPPASGTHPAKSSISPASSCCPPLPAPKPSAIIGRLKTDRITPAMAASAKMTVAFGAIPASSHGCDPLRPIGKLSIRDGPTNACLILGPLDLATS
jgi:hypothetical protein